MYITHVHMKYKIIQMAFTGPLTGLNPSELFFYYFSPLFGLYLDNHITNVGIQLVQSLLMFYNFQKQVLNRRIFCANWHHTISKSCKSFYNYVFIFIKNEFQVSGKLYVRVITPLKSQGKVKTNPVSYCGIRLLSTLGKAVERIMIALLMDVLGGSFWTWQFGF